MTAAALSISFEIHYTSKVFYIYKENNKYPPEPTFGYIVIFTIFAQLHLHMKVLIKKAFIRCGTSPFHLQTKDILIENGMIANVAHDIEASDVTLISQDGLELSTGWVDTLSDFADPGNEQKETIITGARAAAAGGFTDVILMPDTYPTLSNKAQLEYILQKAAGTAVFIHPMGTVTKDGAGSQLAEMYEMYNSGAIAFSDGRKPLQHAGVMLKALQYVLPANKRIVQLPNDKSLKAHGLMNEGITSTKLGLPGSPAIAEELMITRDIALVKYTGGKLHVSCVSTANGLAQIAAAKADVLDITCSVTPHHAWFCDEDLDSYDCNLKVEPPLRSRADMLAVRAALQTGAVDCIGTQHLPHHWDDKTCEFEYAKPGMIGLQTAFAVLLNAGVNIDDIITLFTDSARAAFALPPRTINIGETACITLFNCNTPFTFTKENNQSASQNSPFFGTTFKGSVVGIINKNTCVLNPYHE